jgi:hypothetical protein
LREAIGRHGFHEAGHVVAAWSRGLRTHSATSIPTPEFRGHVPHGNPWHGIRRNAALAGVRCRAESAIIVHLAAQRRHSPRSWRSYHGAFDFEHAIDVATGLNGSEEAALAYLDWLAIVTRDEIAALWPQVEMVAQALVDRRTLTAAGSRPSWRAPDTMRNERRRLVVVWPLRTSRALHRSSGSWRDTGMPRCRIRVIYDHQDG